MSAQAARRPVAPLDGRVVALDGARIVHALRARKRYRYVQPRVAREGLGWLVASPNCSRNVDAMGGEIPVAWLVPASDGLWLLYRHDHARHCWELQQAGVTLPQALQQLCEDPRREFWP